VSYEGKLASLFTIESQHLFGYTLLDELAVIYIDSVCEVYKCH
jgi:hypothetical protein